MNRFNTVFIDDTKINKRWFEEKPPKFSEEVELVVNLDPNELIVEIGNIDKVTWMGGGLSDEFGLISICIKGPRLEFPNRETLLCV